MKRPALVGVLLLAVSMFGAPPAQAQETRPREFGATLDWGVDGARAYSQRLDARPALLDKPVVLPITEDERAYVSQFFAQAADVRAEPSMTLEPTIPLEALQERHFVEVAELLDGLTKRYGTDASVTLAPDMNRAARPWGLRPAAYVRAARSLAGAVDRSAPRLRVVWSPAHVDRANPYSGAPATLPETGTRDFRRLDTTGDGAIDGRDDPYGPYWPGVEAVDEVGLSVYHLGSSAPSRGALVRALRGSSRDNSRFYNRFVKRPDRPLVLRTAAALKPGKAGYERAIKAAWERQVLSAETQRALPGMRRIIWLEVAQREPAADGALVDWRATRTPQLARDLRAVLEAGPVALAPSGADDARNRGDSPEAAGSLTGPAAWAVAGGGFAVGLILLVLGLSGRLARWRYPTDADHRRRDLRIDLLRGLAIIFVVVNHLNVPSAYHLVSQEAIGPVSGAEMFVALSGVVLALVYRERAERSVRKEATLPVWLRARKLYVTALIVVVAAYLVEFLPGVDAKVLTTFTDQGVGGASGTTYDLYGGLGGRFPWPLPDYIVGDLLLLQLGPFQFNVMGLYVVLLLVTPFLFAALDRGRLLVVLGLSGTLYALDHVHPIRAFPSQFEDAFPLLTWQVLFVLGLVVGWYRAEILRFAGTRPGRAVIGGCVVLFLAGMFFSWNNPYLSNEYDARLAIIPEPVFYDLYGRFFERTTLGVGRLLDVVLVLVVLYAALTAFWRPVAGVLGPVLIPLGQATLYVFILHVFFAVVIANVPVLSQGRVLYGTLAHTAVLFALWLMVRKRFLFNVIPR